MDSAACSFADTGVRLLSEPDSNMRMVEVIFKPWARERIR